MRDDHVASPRLRQQFSEEVARLALPGVAVGAAVTAAELASLPEPARRYFLRMGVVGKARDATFVAQWFGRFRRTPDEPWRDVEAWQFNSGVEVARVFHMRFPMGGLLPVYVRDTYLRGHGRMLGRALDLIPVVEGEGDSFDLGELVTWLDDAVLLAPSMLLRPEVEFRAVDAQSFDIALTDRDHTVRARVTVDRDGAPTNLRTTDRYVADPFIPGHPIVRAEWSTPVESWQAIDGRPVPLRGSAVWRLRGSEFVYAELTLAAARWNVPPGA